MIVHDTKKMQSKPLISILTPCRNAHGTLMATAESVKAQTYPHWQWLLVDDGSTDGTVELIQTLQSKDPRIQLIHNPVAGSPSRSRQMAFMQSQGEYCAFLDADDLWLPEKLEKQLQFAQQNHFDFTFHGYRRISLDGSKVGEYLGSSQSVGVAEILSERTIGNLTVMVKRSVLEGLEFPHGMSEDFRLWLKIMKKGVTAHFLDQDLARYRIVPGSRGSKKISVAQDIFNLYWQDPDLRVDQKLLYFTKYAVNSLKKYSRF